MRRLSTTVAMVATLGLALTPATALAATSDEQTPADRAAAYGSPRWQTQYEQNLRAEIDPAHPVQWIATSDAPPPTWAPPATPVPSRPRSPP